MDTSTDTSTQQTPNRPYCIRSCVSLRNPAVYQRARAEARSSTAIRPWATAIQQFTDAPFGDQNASVATNWQGAFAETLFQCLVPYDDFDAEDCASNLRVLEEDPLVDLCASFHHEIYLIHRTISETDGFWQLEACQQHPFSGDTPSPACTPSFAHCCSGTTGMLSRPVTCSCSPVTQTATLTYRPASATLWRATSHCVTARVGVMSLTVEVSGYLDISSLMNPSPITVSIARYTLHQSSLNRCLLM